MTGYTTDEYWIKMAMVFLMRKLGLIPENYHFEHVQADGMINEGGRDV